MVCPVSYLYNSLSSPVFLSPRTLFSDAPPLYNWTYIQYLTLLCTTERTGDKSKRDLQSEHRTKESATKELLKKYTTANLSETELQRIVDSVSDNEAYLSFNVLPVERAIKILKGKINLIRIKIYRNLVRR